MIRVNGKTYSGNNIQMVNGKVIIDGKEVGEKSKEQDFVITIEKGAIVNLNCDESVTVNGNVMNIVAQKNINCDKVKGSITAGGNVNCDDVGGNIEAGGNVNCDNVKGNITAKKVNHG
jgi:hypothetical protein